MQNFFRSLLITATLITAGYASAAEVTGIYEGVVATDSGLGLVGQTMRVEVTYDDSTVGSASGSATLYSGLVTSSTVTIGSNVWNYDGSGTSSLFLRDNDVVVFSNGPEDRVSLNAGDFTGPDLGTGPIVFGPSLAITLSDVEPAPTPDAVDDDTVLPSSPFDPGLFDNGPALSNSLRFDWFVGDGETSVFITMDQYSLIPQATPSEVSVPLPIAALVILALSLIATARMVIAKK